MFMPINLKTHIRFHRPLKNLTESFQGQALFTLHGTLCSSMNNFPRHKHGLFLISLLCISAILEWITCLPSALHPFSKMFNIYIIQELTQGNWINFL